MTSTHIRFSPLSRPCLHRRRVERTHARTIVAAQCISSHQVSKAPPQETSGLHTRRSILLTPGVVYGLAPWLPALASEGSAPSAVTYTTYTDPQDGFSLLVPAGWAFGEGTLEGNSSFSGASGARRTLAWFPEDANPRDVNVTLTITNVSVEFTRLGSFGSAYSFGSSLVNSQDRSYLLRGPAWARSKEPIQIAKLVDAAELGGRYWVEYTVQKLPEPQRHLYTILALGYNGTYNRLYTLTGQALEEQRPRYEAALLAMVRSLSVQPARA